MGKTFNTTQSLDVIKLLEWIQEERRKLAWKCALYVNKWLHD